MIVFLLGRGCNVLVTVGSGDNRLGISKVKGALETLQHLLDLAWHGDVQFCRSPIIISFRKIALLSSLLKL